MDNTSMRESQSSQRTHSESEEELRAFMEAVETEYSKQSNSPVSVKYSQIQPLVAKLQALQNVKIPKRQQKTFIQYLLQYIEMALSCLSNYEDSEYRKQKNYGSTMLTFIPNLFEESDTKNTFIKEATEKILDLFMYGDFTTVSKSELLKILNSIAAGSNKALRRETAKQIEYYKYKLLDCLSTYGDYVIQSDIMETLFRIFGAQIRDEVGYDLLPDSRELGQALKEISIQTFDADIRSWLNKFNNESQLIFSIECQMLMFGNTICARPDDVFRGLWVDFNMKDNVISFFTDGLSNDACNRNIIMAKDVKKVEVKRQLQFVPNENTTTISMQLSKPCFSEAESLQDYWNSMDKHFKMIISNDEKEKITKLITQILPRVFGDTFSHTSTRISDRLKKVYKPLAIKISKKKSTASELSSLTSKSKSDGTTVPQPGPSRHVKRVASSASKSKTDNSSTIEIKQSASRPDALLRDDVVSVVITDMTRVSSCRSEITSERASVINSNDSDIFSDEPTSPDRLIRAQSLEKEGEEKLQDNIVTSSHGLDDDLHVSSQIEILSGSSWKPISVHKGIEFQASEVFSSSPIKRSTLNIQDLSDDVFESAENTDLRIDGVVHQEAELVEAKFSALNIPEDIFDDDFETAVENLDENTINEIAKALDLEKSDSKVKEGDVNCMKKISHCTDSSNLRVQDISDDEVIPATPRDNKKVSKTIARADSSEKNDLKREVQSNKNKLSRLVIRNDREVIEDNDDAAVKYGDADIEMIEKPQKVRSKKMIRNKKKELLREAEEEKIQEPHQEFDDEELPLRKLSRSKTDCYIQKPNLDANLDSPAEDKNFEGVTQDLFGVPNQLNEPVIVQQSKHETDSEEIFSRSTQPMDENIQPVEENFTELSLAVNVGILENEYSEDVVVIKPAAGSNKKSSKKKDKEDLVVVTGDGVTEKKKRSVLNPCALDKEDTKKVAQKPSLLNTPELLVILAPDSSQGALRENQYSEEVAVIGPAVEVKKKSRKIRISVPSQSEDKENIIDLSGEGVNEEVEHSVLSETSPIKKEIKKVAQKELMVILSPHNSQRALKGAEVLKDKNVQQVKFTTDQMKEEKQVQKKKPRRMMKSGKKQFTLEDVETELPTQSDPVINTNETESSMQVDEGVCVETHLEEAMEKLASVHSEENQKEEVCDKVISEPLNVEIIEKNLEEEPRVQVENRNDLENLSSDSEIELAPEINVDNVDFIETFNKLKNLKQRTSSEMSGIVQKRTAKRLPSEEEEIASQNISLGDVFDKLKTTSHIDGALNDEAIENVTSEKVAVSADIPLGKKKIEGWDTTPSDEISNKPPKLPTKVSKAKRNKKKNIAKADAAKAEVAAGQVVEVEPTDVQENDDVPPPGDQDILKDDVHPLPLPDKPSGDVITSINVPPIDKQDILKGYVDSLPLPEKPSADVIAPIDVPSLDKQDILERDVDRLLVPDRPPDRSDRPVIVMPGANREVALLASSPDSSPTVHRQEIVCVEVHPIKDNINDIVISGEQKEDNRDAFNENVDPLPKCTSVADKPVKHLVDLIEAFGDIDQIIPLAGNTKVGSPKIPPQEVSKDTVTTKNKKDVNVIEDIEIDNEPYFKKRKSTGNVVSNIVKGKTLPRKKDTKSGKKAGGDTKMETTVGGRKLFRHGSYSYLDKLGMTEQGESPDLDITPVPVEKGTKTPRQRKPRTKKQQEESAEKPKRARKNENSAKVEPKKRRPRAKKEFSFKSTPNKSLNELFDMSCRGLRHCGYEYSFGQPRSILHRPLDIVARHEPTIVSSDEGLTPPNKRDKRTSPELSKTVLEPKTPTSSSGYSWAELEVEPVKPKITILENIVIKPRKILDEEVNRIQSVEDVPVPRMMEEGVPEPSVVQGNELKNIELSRVKRRTLVEEEYERLSKKRKLHNENHPKTVPLSAVTGEQVPGATGQSSTHVQENIDRKQMMLDLWNTAQSILMEMKKCIDEQWP